MIALPGGFYLITLSLRSSERLGNQWLVGATSARYPLAEVVSVERYDGSEAELLIRWRKEIGEILIGDQITPVLQGTLIPFEVVPQGTVTDVAQVGEPEMEAQRSISSPFKAAIAGGLLLVTWYLVERIKRRR